MERIQVLINRALNEGLGIDKAELDEVTNQPGTKDELSNTSTTAWEAIDHLLWAAEKEDATGLISGLKSTAEDTTKAVNQALKDCDGTFTVLIVCIELAE